jgi:hypothetical protein
MEDRGFNEVDLRDLLEPNRWEVVVGPDHEDERLVVVTAYAVD